MIYYSLSALINAITSLVLGVLVLRKKKTKTNIIFSLFSFSVSFWSFAYFFWQISDNKETALFWCRLLTAGTDFIPLFYLQFTVNFLRIEKKIINKYLLIVGYFFTVIFVLISYTNLLVEKVVPKSFFLFWPKPGIAYVFLLFLFFFYSIYSAYLFLSHFRKSIGIYREQIKFLLFGTGFGFLGGMTNFFLWYDINIPPFGNILVSLYVILTAYAIIKHRLMDIKVVMRKYSVYLLSLFSVLSLAMSVKYLVEIFIGQQSIVVDFFVIMISLLIYPFLKENYYRLANKYFFSSLYDSKELIAEMSDELGRTLEIKKIYNLIYKSLLNALHFKSFAILKYNENNNNYLVQFNRGFNIGRRKKFPCNEDLFELFERENQILVVDELRKNNKNSQFKKSIELFDSLDVQIFVPLNIKDKTIGLLVFGSKESKDLYNDEDLQVLQIISSQVAMAIENATLYQETLDFNLKLGQEVEKATHDLRLANEKLTKLDQAKSEFISIASHQLRTPLTVIKGYISMMLEKSFGDLSDTETDALKKVYESNERLIKLVENLLNISRIESGRLQFLYEDMHLETVVDSVVGELETTAKKKKLKLIYKKPKKLLPLVKLDAEKIRQVIMNLIDNSIKYTNRGTVTVTLKQAKKNIEFSVSDSGMGISKSDLKNLFKKFSRGKDVSLVHTEGTGLGLFVAKQMIQYHKGKIWAESRGVGKGSRFVFTLPIIK